jgi:release factor glutamine methyltransferase
MTASEALAHGTKRLRAAGVPGPARDARRLLAHALGIVPDRLTLYLPEPVPEVAAGRFEAALDARCRRQPVAQIVGHRAFYGRRFKVTGDVLDPRPETETLVAAVLDRPAGRILDIGTGSGCILATLLAEWPGAQGVGTDTSAAALCVAQANARALGCGARARFVCTDWATGVEGPFDLIVSNPPYIAAGALAGLSPEVRHWEPRDALSGGADGLAAYRALLPQAAARLGEGGRVAVETGAGQAAAVAAIGQAAGLPASRTLDDLDGRGRVVLFTPSQTGEVDAVA